MEERTKKKRKVGLKAFAIIAIIIVVLAVIFFINFVRNYVILNEIIEKEAKFKDSTNYSYVSEHYNSNDEEDKVVVEHYYKDGNSKIIMDNGENKITVWYDEETKENIFLNETTKEATITSSPFMLGTELLYFNEEDSKIYFALTSFITNDIVNGKDCYNIRNSGIKASINKEDGTVAKAINGKAVIDGKEYDSITGYKNWQFDKLTDEDMKRPDLTGYKVVNK